MLIFLLFLISKLISCQEENNSYLIEEAFSFKNGTTIPNNEKFIFGRYFLIF